MDDKALENIEIYGDELNTEHQRIEFLMLPCNYLHTDTGWTGDTIHPDCIHSLEEYQKYLVALDWKIYHTQELFNPQGYGDDTIIRKSFMFN